MIYKAAVLGLILGLVAARRYSDECLVPLAADSKPLCPQIEALSNCYVSTYVTVTDRQSLKDSILAMSTILKRLKEESCDLNYEFNNECHEGFPDCLDLALETVNGELRVSCSDYAYDQFQQCIDIRLDNSYGYCYYSRWVELMVNNSRALDCTNPPPPPPPPKTTPKPSGEHDSRYSCVYGDARYHVLNKCTQFQMETIATGQRHAVQNVAAGTLFDIHVCGLQHKAIAYCPL